MKNLTKRIFAGIMLFLILVLMILPFVGCSSKKKALEKSKLELKIEKEVDSSGSYKSKIEIKTQANTAAKQLEKSKQVEYEGTPGDKLTVTEKDGAGNVLKETIYEGSGKLKTTNEEKQLDSTTAENKQEDTQTENKAAIKKKDSQDKKEALKKVEVEKEGISFWFWFWISIVIIIAIIILYLNHRFKWLARVTAYFKK